MAVNLASLQESYITGLRQMTGGGQKKVAVATPERAGLGNRPKQPKAKEYAFYGNGRNNKLKAVFDISNKAVVASLFFWILIMYGIYVLGGYCIMALRVIYQDMDLRGDCQAEFSLDPQENMKMVFNYPKGEAGPYIARFATEFSSKGDYPVEAKQLPPLVTAVTSAQFYQLQGLIKHVHEDLKAEHSDIKLIVYDIGLYRREKEILKQYCGCEVRTMDYSVYPDHIADTTNFAWRPIVIQTLLQEYGAVVYLDVTTRFKTSNSVNFVKERGQKDFMLWDFSVFTGTTAYTNKHTFTFFNETRCLFSEASMLDSQIMVFYKSNRTWTHVMKPWLKCALSVDCIAPRWARYWGCLHYRHPMTTGCHRYDLSALSIVLNRGMQLTSNENGNNIPPRLAYTTDEEVTLFLEQPWTYTQLYILMATPVLFLVLIFRKKLVKCLSSTMLKDG